MVVINYYSGIDDYEEELQEVANEVSNIAASKQLTPTELASKAKKAAGILKNLVRKFREAMLILKPERKVVIEQSVVAVIQPLKAFNDLLFQKTEHPYSNSKLALEQLRKAVLKGYDLLILAKEIRDDPSPVIKDILTFREVYETKEYLTTIQAPETFQIRLKQLLEHLETLSVSLANLEKDLSVMRDNLDNVRKESFKLRSDHLERLDKDSKETVETVSKEHSPTSFSQ